MLEQPWRIEEINPDLAIDQINATNLINVAHKISLYNKNYLNPIHYFVII